MAKQKEPNSRRRGGTKKKIAKDSSKEEAKSLYGFSETDCHCCGVSNTEIGGFLLQCASCRRAYYCSMDCFNKHLPKHLEFCETSALEQEPEGRKDVKKEVQKVRKEAKKLPEKAVKRNFIDDSCSESETETESIAGKPSKKTSFVKRVINDGICSESETATESMAGRPRYTPKKSSLVAPSNDSDSQSEAEPTSMRMPSQLRQNCRHSNKIKRTFTDGACSESETEPEPEPDAKDTAPASESILYAAFKGVPHELDLDECESDCDTDSELDSDEWETDSDSYSSESESSHGALSRDTGSLDMVMEVTEKDSDDDISEDEEGRTSNTGAVLCTDVPQFDWKDTPMQQPPRPECPTAGSVLCRTSPEESCDRAAARPSRSADNAGLDSDDYSDFTTDSDSVADGKRRRRRIRKSDSASDLTSDGDEGVTNRRKSRTGTVLCRGMSKEKEDSAAGKPFRSRDDILEKEDSAAVKPSRSRDDVLESDDGSQESHSSTNSGDEETADKTQVVGKSVSRRKEAISPQVSQNCENKDNSGDDSSFVRGETDGRVHTDDDDGAANGDENTNNEKIRMRNRLANLWTLPVEADASKRRKVHLSHSMKMEETRMHNRLGNLWKLPELKEAAQITEEEQHLNEEGKAVECADWSDNESDVEETRRRRGGGAIVRRVDNPVTNRTESITSLSSVALRPAERTESSIEWEKPEWTESQ
jgi:hypothetical protein